MNILSWGIRSELLTQSFILQTVLAKLLEKETTRRDVEQLQIATDFIKQIMDLKTIPTYVLIEKHALEPTESTSSQWQKLLVPIELGSITEAAENFKSILAGEEVEDRCMVQVLNLLTRVSFDLSYE
jgi:hypothetical protein